MQVIQFHDVTGREMVGRYPVEGTTDIRWGSQLVVEETQEAIFLRDGKALDTFGPGRHRLTTKNIPLLSSLLRIPFNKSPFQAAVIFLSRKTFLDLRWGTQEAIAFRDRELGIVRLRAFGKYAIRIADPQPFVNQLVGTLGHYETDALERAMKDVIVARFTDFLGEASSSIFDLPALYDEMAEGLEKRIVDDFGRFGVELVQLWIGAITPTAEVQKRIDERSSMAAVADLDAYMKFKAATALGDAAVHGGAGSALGAAVGVGLGMMMPHLTQAQRPLPGVGAPPALPTASGSAVAAALPSATSAPIQGEASSAAGEVIAPSTTEPSVSDVSGSVRGPAAFCHQCGGSLPKAARFCPACGQKVAG